MPASAHSLRDWWARGFRAVEALRNREKGGDLEGSVEEDSEEEEEDGVAGAERSSEVQQRASLAGGKSVERRARSGGSSAPPAQGLELLAIPGVGPRNLRKLVDKGFEGVAQLKQLYVDKVYDCVPALPNSSTCIILFSSQSYLELAHIYEIKVKD